ncbi:MAG: tyrosine-type recombinase/integrase [Isosphaeraceae bacterium]
MPTPEELNWQPERRGWRIQYQKLRKTISCRQLKKLGYLRPDAPETKESSIRAANSWFEDFKKQTDAGRPAPTRHPLQGTLDTLQRRLDYAKRHGMRPDVESLSNEAEDVKAITAAEADDLYMGEVVSETALGSMATAKLFGINVPPGVPPIVLNKLFGDDRVWHDRLAREQNHPVPQDRTVAGQIKAYLQGQVLKVKAGTMTAARYDNLTYIYKIIQNFLGGDIDAATINEADIERFYMHMLGKVAERKKEPKSGYSESYADTVWGMFKAFVRYLYAKRMIELPRNLDHYKIEVKRQKIVICSKDEVKLFLDNANGQLKLHVLLMLNCGYRSTDIATLRDAEVDWEQGRIIRKRHKTKDEENVPEVNYKLWSETFDLLKRWRSGQETVLLTKSGGLWAFDELMEKPDGSVKVKQTDNIATNFKRLRVTVGIDKPLALLRKTAGSELDHNDEFGRYAEHFLGEAPDRIATIHYLTPSQERFDAALAWLGKRFEIE